MKLLFGEDGWHDYLHWARGGRDIFDRVDRLIEDARRYPFAGLGKPEPLKGELAGWWSRRITGGHRLVGQLPRAMP